MSPTTLTAPESLPPSLQCIERRDSSRYPRIIGVSLVLFGCLDPGESRYVGSASCQGCHPTQVAGWRGSEHAAAMQVANDSTVLGDFREASVTLDGVTSHFRRRDSAFVVETAGPDGRIGSYEVQYTFGLAPLQQYLVPFPGGRLQPLTLSWDTRPRGAGGQRWLALDAVAPLGPDDEGHWTGRALNWNYMCADCHATGVRKGYVAATDSFATTWTELGVGCEGCHGPAGAHTRWQERPSWIRWLWRTPAIPAPLNERRNVSWIIDITTGNAVRTAPRATDHEIEVCAQCHARRVHIAEGYEAGRRYADYYDTQLLTLGLYHADGQQRDEVYNYGSFLQSRMYAKGVTCADCHDPHTQKLRSNGNSVCGTCHLTTKYDTAAHHGHRAGSTGASCASCHMPTTTYLEVAPRHDHSIRVPRPDRADRLGVPSACAGCHADRGARWADSAMLTWTGGVRRSYQTFADAFAADDSLFPNARQQLMDIVREAAQPAVVRASALARLTRHADSAVAALAESSIGDRSVLVRRGALDAIAALPASMRIGVAGPLLSDSLRSVRQQAAWLLAPVGDSLPTAFRAAFARAAREFEESQRYNADRAEHRVTLGAWYFMRGDTAAAERELRWTTEHWPHHVIAWTNLAGLRSLAGRESEAEGLLREALLRMPQEAELHFQLGASLARQGRNTEARVALQRARTLAPERPDVRRALELLR